MPNSTAASSGQFDEPALTVHWRAEGRHEYTVLAFIPGSRPFDLFDPARKGRNKLYVRRVLITQDADLLPGWLRFVRLVVDSADLPLNVSREMIQESAVFAAIRKGVTNRVVQELGKLAESEPEKFAKVWEHFGAVIKEGLYEDPERRDAPVQARALRHHRPTPKAAARSPTMSTACARTRRRSTISPATTPSASPPARSSKGFRARGVEVLLLADPVDAFWVSTAAGFDGKPFKSVSQGAADIKAIAARRGRDGARRSDRRGRDAVRLLQADAGERGRRRARFRPPDRQRRLSRRAGIRARPAAREDARRARALERARQADARGQRRPIR